MINNIFEVEIHILLIREPHHSRSTDKRFHSTLPLPQILDRSSTQLPCHLYDTSTSRVSEYRFIGLDEGPAPRPGCRGDGSPDLLPERTP